MTINSKRFNGAMQEIQRGYEGLPEDTEGMKQRKDDMLIATGEVYDMVISKGINNITSNHIWEIYSSLRKDKENRNKTTVISRAMKELNLFDFEVEQRYLKDKFNN